MRKIGSCTTLLFLVCTFLLSPTFSMAQETSKGPCPAPIPTVSGDPTFSPGWAPFRWAPGNPQVIDDTPIQLLVINGMPPYQWSVAEEGFSTDPAATGDTNTLTASETACGSATITVTDGESQVTSGTLRSACGRWVEIAFYDVGFPENNYGDWNNCYGVDPSTMFWDFGFYLSAINGKYKVSESTGNTYKGGECMEKCPTPDPPLCLTGICGGCKGSGVNDGYCRFLNNRYIFEWRE